MKYCLYCLLFPCLFLLHKGVLNAQCTADAGPERVLTCTDPEVTLSGASNVPNASFAWSGPGGFTSTEQSPAVSLPGLYLLTITDPGDGCTATDQVAVAEDKILPAISLSPTPACNNDGGLIITGGGPGFQYLWSTGDTASSLQNLTGGLYCVTVTGPNGCTDEVCGVVTQLPLALVGFSVTEPLEDKKNGQITLTPIPPGAIFAYQWSGPNGFTAITPVVSGLDSGTYVVTVTNPVSGCSAVYDFTLVRTYLPLSIYNIINCDGLVHFQIAPSNPPYTIDWSGGSQVVGQPEASVLLSPGVYTITVTDSGGASKTITITIPQISPPCTYIEGFIRYDDNSNCLTDSAESGFGGWYIRAIGNGSKYYAVSDPEGYYRLRTEPGTFSLAVFPQGGAFSACANDVPVLVASAGDTARVNFSIQGPDPGCPSLEVHLGTPRLRRCFDNNFYYLRYQNNSLAPATDAYIDLRLDPMLEVVGASRPYTDLGNGIFRFQLGTVLPFYPGYFWVQVAVSCDAVLGQSHCSTAHIYPDTLCDPPNPVWSGALVEVHARCESDSLRFIVKNTGTGPMSETSGFIVIEDGMLGLQGTAPKLVAGDSFVVSVAANGAWWRFEAEQEPFAPPAPGPVRSVEGCVMAGDFSKGWVNQFSLGDEVPWLDENCTPNTGAYDPNDKQGFPTGYGAKRYIRPGTELEYLIRFQNTGNDTAFTVVIRDTLSEWLDPLTVRSGVSSHPYRFELTGKGLLIFDFQNILLPDSNVNEPASHGFVQYRIRPRADVPLETDIFNSAAIYFDFNDPIITNTTVHRIGENFISVGFWEPRKPAYTVSVYPQPMSDAAWIEVKGPAGAARLRIFDQTGRQVLALDAAEPRFLLRRGDLPAGMYFFRVEMDGAVIGSGKLIAR
ncbi:MAG: hypothetical protein L6Q97_09890 [Thermoanaerobaculia bacterium]|nr:hypothetical protein [Thermoanaerobaculia bacterium]